MPEAAAKVRTVDMALPDAAKPLWRPTLNDVRLPVGIARTRLPALDSSVGAKPARRLDRLGDVETPDKAISVAQSVLRTTIWDSKLMFTFYFSPFAIR